jgi:hypothetical protein
LGTFKQKLFVSGRIEQKAVRFEHDNS